MTQTQLPADAQVDEAMAILRRIVADAQARDTAKPCRD